MSGFLKSLLITTILILSLLLLLGILLPNLVKPATLESFLVDSVEKNSEYLLAVENPTFSIFPTPSFHFSNVKIWDKKGGKIKDPFASANKVKCKLKRLIGVNT